MRKLIERLYAKYLRYEGEKDATYNQKLIIAIITAGAIVAIFIRILFDAIKRF